MAHIMEWTAILVAIMLLVDRFLHGMQHDEDEPFDLDKTLSTLPDYSKVSSEADARIPAGV